ncbi:actin-related protein 8-like [Humulus lupulus]|uniref:actin-related protein 8-like n=1 Tax=Humulus lupulus TaxID=3486 RepID=UPI002B4082FB|nr:actin-related protein 8-like [Humulus lupulus]
MVLLLAASFGLRRRPVLVLDCCYYFVGFPLWAMFSHMSCLTALETFVGVGLAFSRVFFRAFRTGGALYSVALVIPTNLIIVETIAVVRVVRSVMTIVICGWGSRSIVNATILPFISFPLIALIEALISVGLSSASIVLPYMILQRNSYEDYKSGDKKDVEIESFELAVLQMKNCLFSFPDPNKILRCDRTIQSFAKTGEGGSGYCKYGWSKYAAPSVRSTTFLVRAPSQPVVVSMPILHYDDTESAKASRRQLKEAIYTTLFNMNVLAVCAINQATLALYAARRTSGIVVNIGFQVTSVVPILHGKVMHKVGVEVVGLGALKLIGFLKELMQQNNISFESLYTVRTLKENLCYVAYDYEAELLKDTRASSDAAGEGQFTLSKERFQTGEILFQPRMAGV